LLESVNNGLISRKLRADYLERNRPVQFAIARFVDCSHAAFAKNCRDLIPVGK
jgi:hypothetical protein